MTELRVTTAGQPKTSNKKAYGRALQAIAVAQSKSSYISTSQASMIYTITDDEFKYIQSILFVLHSAPLGSAGSISASSLTSANLYSTSVMDSGRRFKLCFSYAHLTSRFWYISNLALLIRACNINYQQLPSSVVFRGRRRSRRGLNGNPVGCY